MEVTVRPAIEGDYDEMCKIYAEVDSLHSRALPDVFRDAPWPPRPREHINELINSEDATLIVAEVEGRIVGVLDANIRSAPDYPIVVPRRYAHISEIAIAESYRGRGIGQLLMQEAHRWAFGKGITEVELNVWEFNKGAIAFYEKLGYETARRTMRKPLK